MGNEEYKGINHSNGTYAFYFEDEIYTSDVEIEAGKKRCWLENMER